MVELRAGALRASIPDQLPMSEMTASINERAAEEYFRRALEAETQGIHEKAIEFYERALNENPDHEKACFNLAVLYDRR
ncbi:MAG TPA: tetratricopeptide repeat protein, partial [Tepidisphaeraceae bacterium]|nr:tetratricopeptide repeat protein [Tepidisphaeraceae bacterium]